MKLKGILLMGAAALALQACSNYQPRVYTPAPLAEGQQVEPFNDFCFFDTEPNGAAFTVLKRVVVGGGFYGSADGLKPKLEDKAKKQGGNSVANYKGSQRFGFWPWRFIRPVVSGDAIQILNANGKSCEELGGHH
ncbi:MAG: hypothetical protein IK012_01630 [Fibrobacter sp.]|uniref:hypothetical protein n=1 Tax=Fibrobacter sp. TaxID=35828 RepID=UPI0025C3EB7B|nr:hypothetical protein [Fibrobacter sp.]MBR4783939.1 hypothetical protein [Fibrobacter sp.]